MATRKTTESDEVTGMVVPKSGRISDETLSMIGNTDFGTGDAFADAMAIAEGVYGEIHNAGEVLGNGFALLDDKSKLVGKALLALYWTFHPGDYGQFVSIAVVTAEKIDGHQKFIVNDGSTGICAQLDAYTTTHDGRNGGLAVRQGLRESTYATCKGCERPRPSDVDVCENTLSNGTQCGNNDTTRGTGETYYLDLSA